MAGKSVFEVFKKEKTVITVTKGKVISVVFCLLFDDSGAYIEVRNEKGKVVEVDYQHYSGVVRTILKQVQTIHHRSDFVVDWEHPTNQVYLHENDSLIELLLQSKVWITEEGTVINALPTKGILQLLLTDLDDGININSTLVLWASNKTHNEFNFINENHVFVDGVVVETEPVGSNFKALPFFNTAVKTKDLAKFLSIFYSFTKHIDLVYDDYTVLFSKHSISTTPVLLFEKIDIDEALCMRVSQILPDIDARLLSDYELTYFAAINDLERLVEVKLIEQENNDDSVREVEKLLQKHIPKGDKNKTEGDIILENDLFIIPREIASDFIYNDLPDLLATYKIMGAENLKAYKVSTIRPRLELKLTHGLDFLGGDASLHFNNEAFSLFDALQQYAKNKYITLSDGTHAIVNEDYMQKLRRIFNKDKDNVSISFFDLPLAEELIDGQVAEIAFARSKEIFEGFNHIHKSENPLPLVNATLRPYQEQGYHWLKYLQSVHLNGCLADDMGLGKTLQTITLLASIYPEETLPTLIVMPKSLLFNWEKELDKFAPQLSYYVYHAPGKNLEEALKSNLIITTYSMMRNDIEKLKEQQFFYVILDESQNIKNVVSQASKAVMLLQAKHKLALSGTPIENHLGELYALFRFLNPTMFGTLEKFNEFYLTPIQKDNNKNATADLRKKIYPFILRRLKKDVLEELPDKIEQVLYVEMSHDQKKLYEQRRQYYQEAIQKQIASKGIQSTQFFVFQALSELRQLASTPEAISSGLIKSPKIEILMEQLMDALANKHKVLVFVNFLAALELIGDKLEEQGVDYVSMSGSTKNRQQLVERFQTDINCKVFLLTLKTGGTGLNLTAADMVFVFDPWWNKAAENQAIDRTHRIGQDKTVLTYKLITKDTIEDKILLLQEQKAEIFNNIISADSASLKSISEDDIQFMLGV